MPRLVWKMSAGRGQAEVIRECKETDFDEIWEIINDAAQAYKGVIPEDRWPDPENTPYMSREKLQAEIADGVQFWGYSEDERSDGPLDGVMGVQKVEDVTLIRHAYVRVSQQKKGIGTKLLSNMLKGSIEPVLVGAWTHATWAIHFYEKHGFTLVESEVKVNLLNRYWKVPAQQIDNSVVLADRRWMAKLEAY